MDVEAREELTRALAALDQPTVQGQPAGAGREHDGPGLEAAAVAFFLRQARVRRQRGDGGAGLKFSVCPACGQANVKDRNNLLRCVACTAHFCAACRTTLRRKPGLHFVGGGGCRQHDNSD